MFRVSSCAMFSLRVLRDCDWPCRHSDYCVYRDTASYIRDPQVYVCASEIANSFEVLLELAEFLKNNCKYPGGAREITSDRQR